MDEGQRDAIRTALEMQFRYKFYQDTVFPYYQSLGIVLINTMNHHQFI